MHHTAPSSPSKESMLLELAPASATLADTLIHLLHQVLTLSQPDASLLASVPRRRGQPARLTLPHLALALLLGCCMAPSISVPFGVASRWKPLGRLLR